MTGGQRIVSFLPAATEMIYALGLGDRLLGRSHECDYPPPAKDIPIAVRNALRLGDMSLAEIDVAVTARLREGKSLYEVDERLITDLAPDLIVTQDLCQVCAPSGSEVAQLLKMMAVKPDILWLTPKCLQDIFDNVRSLGERTGSGARAEQVVADVERRIGKVAEKARTLGNRPRVFCMEWVDPIYCCGHWVPEMVSLAGGSDPLGRKGSDSVRIDLKDVLACSPEILIVMPCGFGLDKSVQQAKQFLRSLPQADAIPAARRDRIFAVDANSYFARPGPRVADGVELLAHLLHPESFGWHGPSDAFQKISLRLPVPG